MLDLKTRLYLFHDNNTVFSDHSNAAQDYSRDSFAIELSSTEDYLYIGYRKPINSIYVEMSTANTTANSFTFEYYNGTAWAAITPFSDETKGFTRSGFLVWERNLTDDTATTVDSQEAFWYRLRPSVDHSVGTIIQGLNIVFSDDNDLQTEVANISAYLASGTTSHILSHVAARDKINQDLRNSGKVKLNTSTGRFKDINVFDVLNIEQLRELSKWKTLATIFDDVSDRPDDKYDQRSRKYNNRYKSGFNKLQFLGLDDDDDGVADRTEELASCTARILRR